MELRLFIYLSHLSLSFLITLYVEPVHDCDTIVFGEVCVTNNLPASARVVKSVQV